jgi:hypothetical protein
LINDQKNLESNENKIIFFGENDFSFTEAFVEKLKFRNNNYFKYCEPNEKKELENLNIDNNGKIVCGVLISTEFQTIDDWFKRFEFDFYVENELNTKIQELEKLFSRIKILIETGVFIKFGVDATNINKSFGNDIKFNRIQFNNPRDVETSDNSKTVTLNL